MDASDDPPLGAYLDEWLDRRRSQLRPTTFRCYRNTAARYVRPALGEVRLSVIDRRLLERHYGHLLAAGGRNGKPLSPRTVQLTHAVLHCALEDAKVDGLLTTNPATLARPPRRAPQDLALEDDLHVWTTEEVGRFLDAVDDHPLRAVWHLAVGTGARRGELLGLRWQDVDLDSDTVTIRRSLTVADGVVRLLGTKTSRSRVLSIGPTSVAALDRQQQSQVRARVEAGAQWRNDWGLVLTEADGQPIPPMHVTREFRRLVRQLPVPVIRFHDLRHTHASLLLAQGAPIKLVSQRLGHATIAMTMDVYAHLLPGMDGDATARLDATISEARHAEK